MSTAAISLTAMYMMYSRNNIFMMKTITDCLFNLLRRRVICFFMQLYDSYYNFVLLLFAALVY